MGRTATLILSLLVLTGCPRQQDEKTASAQNEEPSKSEPTLRGKKASEWVALLGDRDDQTRVEAMTALIELGKDAAPAVAEALKDDDDRVRQGAARVLEQIARDVQLVLIAEQRPDVVIWSAQPFSMPYDPRIESYLAKLPHVKAVAPYLENPALDRHERKIDYCFLKGIALEREQVVSRLKLISERASYLAAEGHAMADAERRAQLEQQASRLEATVDVQAISKRLKDAKNPGCLVGVGYLQRWVLQVGDSVRLSTATNEGQVTEDQQFEIVGVFETGHGELDRRQILMDLGTMQRFVKVEGKLTGYTLELTDRELAPETKAALTRSIREGKTTPFPRQGGYYVKTWQDRLR